MNVARSFNNWRKYRQTITELGRMSTRDQCRSRRCWQVNRAIPPHSECFNARFAGVFVWFENEGTSLGVSDSEAALSPDVPHSSRLLSRFRAGWEIGKGRVRDKRVGARYLRS